jgi:hypothetical protein
MCKKPINRLFLFHIPDTDTLIIGTTGHKLAIITDNQIPNPLLMSLKGAFIEPRANFPKFNGHIPTGRYQKVPVHNKINITNIVIVSMKGLAT